MLFNNQTPYDKEVSALKGVVATILQNYLKLINEVSEPYRSMSPTFCHA